MAVQVEEIPNQSIESHATGITGPSEFQNTNRPADLPITHPSNASPIFQRQESTSGYPEP